MTDPIIKEVSIQPATSLLGDTGARVVLEDGTEGYLFSWFNHEIHFDVSELIGLTVLEAHRLRNSKNQQIRHEGYRRRLQEHHQKKG